MPQTVADEKDDLLRTLEVIETALSSQARHMPERALEILGQTVVISHHSHRIADIYGLLLSGFTWAEACERLHACGRRP